MHKRENPMFIWVILVMQVERKDLSLLWHKIFTWLRPHTFSGPAAFLLCKRYQGQKDWGSHAAFRCWSEGRGRLYIHWYATHQKSMQNAKMHCILSINYRTSLQRLNNLDSLVGWGVRMFKYQYYHKISILICSKT